MEPLVRMQHASIAYSKSITRISASRIHNMSLFFFPEYYSFFYRRFLPPVGMLLYSFARPSHAFIRAYVRVMYVLLRVFIHAYTSCRRRAHARAYPFGKPMSGTFSRGIRSIRNDKITFYRPEVRRLCAHSAGRNRFP